MQEWVGVRPACLCFAKTIINAKVSRARGRSRVIASCSTDGTGLPDKAIILLLARLGLRSGDVVKLRLTDVDWNNGTIRVYGKGRRHDLLPLPQEVGTAVLRYLQKSRPVSRAPGMFAI